MAEEEIKSGEQEREALRIETQRLRDELSDLRIEAEIRQVKLYKAEATIEHQHRRKPSPVFSDMARPQSALSQLSPTTSSSSPTVATPPTKSASSTVSETPTPPSPPTSEKSNPAPKITPAAAPLSKSCTTAADANVTPKPINLSLRPQAHARGPVKPVNSDRTPHLPRRLTLSRPDTTPRSQGFVQSGSLHHLHGLMNKMQLLEQRVHSVRSKLPAPTSTPPRASPRSGSALGQSLIPATVTMRSNKKRAGGSNVSSVHTPAERPSSRLSSAYIGAERPGSRLSFGISQASPSRPPSHDTQIQRPPSRDPNSRPSSRASLSSRQPISHLPDMSASSTSRPGSRQSMSGTRTPISRYSATTQSESRRPRSSIGGSYGNTHGGHGHSASVSRMSNYGAQLHHTDEEEPNEVLTPTPSRRSTFTRLETATSIPALTTPGPRLSGMGAGRRISSGAGDMGPPPERKITRKLSEVGESY